MFDNVGKKIKSFAEISCILFVGVAGLIAYRFVETNPIITVIMIAVACLVGWCSTVCLYGFGELICQTTALRETNEQILHILENQHNNENIQNIVEHQPENNIGNTESA